MVFQHLIDDWSRATNLPAGLRERLSRDCPLAIDAELFSVSEGAAVKALLTLRDGRKVESVLMRHPGGRNTVCVSCQVGCSLGCVFCATGKLGFARDCEPLEIVEQVLLFARHLRQRGERLTNVVFMGMGEPFLNYDNVMRAVQVINRKEGLNIGARRISISTVGIVEGIRRLSGEPAQLNMAVSLNAANDRLRSEIMPVNEKYPIGAVMEAVSGYVVKRKRRVMLEYVMMKGVNDSDTCARELAALVRTVPGGLGFVNLIRYNPTGVFQPSTPARVEGFKALLKSEGVAVTERYRFGQGVRGGCGQLGLHTRD